VKCVLQSSRRSRSTRGGLLFREGHRFEATQALRQVLNRAVAWKLIDDNPAKRAVPNPGRRCREQRVGFANSGGLVFVDESAEQIATA
jgi:hypothetical protein